MIFSKFRPLEHNGGNQIYGLDKKLKDDKFTNNYRFGEILKTSKLHASTFDKFNDIDEGRFCISVDYKKGQNIIQEIRNMKKEKFICSFSCPNGKNFCEDLMWAFYANNHCGVKIDFEIDEPLPNDISPITYTDKEIEIKIQQYISENSPTTIKIEQYIKEKLNLLPQILLTQKKSCWKYEQEYRTFVETDKFDINIKKITLGKKFAILNETNAIIEAQPFTENIISVAKQIIEILKNTDKYKDKLPEIWAYKSLYSTEAQKLSDNL
ncbi:MAG: DUF2971 domain-containing protein [Campylobacter sp.]|nr:DUF2971 domain-containing protein [Campylobacter sp.]